MNKNLNTILLFLGASVGITIISLLIIIIPNVILILILRDGFQTIAPISVSVSFLGAIIGSYAIYAKAMKTMAEKVDMEKYFASWLIKKKSD